MSFELPICYVLTVPRQTSTNIVHYIFSYKIIGQTIHNHSNLISGSVCMQIAKHKAIWNVTRRGVSSNHLEFVFGWGRICHRSQKQHCVWRVFSDEVKERFVGFEVNDLRYRFSPHPDSCNRQIQHLCTTFCLKREVTLRPPVCTMQLGSAWRPEKALRLSGGAVSDREMGDQPETPEPQEGIEHTLGS